MGLIKVVLTDKRKYDIMYGEEKIINLHLIFSPVANKFNCIITFIEDISDALGKEFDEWFVKYLKDYQKSEYDVSVIQGNLDRSMELCDKYLIHRQETNPDFRFSNYVQREKASKNSIFFDAEELEKLIKTSNYLKMYFIISQDARMKPPPKFHREIYNKLVKLISDQNEEIIFKLYKLVSSKTHRYNISDKTMWDFIKIVHCKTTDMHINAIFNFLLNNILVTCNTENNPIPYFSSVIDQSIKWILGGVYKECIIYSDTINTEDIHTIPGKDNLLSYCYNDTIGKLVGIATNYLEEIGIGDIPRFNATVSTLKEPSLIAMYVSYPILSKVFNIPYRYLRPIQVEHSYLLNILTYYYLPKEMKEDLQVITKLLIHYSTQKPILKTTYKIKNTDIFFKTFNSFLGFKNMVFPSNLYSDFIGRLARNEYLSLITDKKIANFPLAKLEDDMVVFYNKYFAGELDDQFQEMRKAIEIHL
jgi:hypothetical protein